MSTATATATADRPDEFAINVALLKRCRFHQILDPDGGPRALGGAWNAHTLWFVAVVVAVQLLIAFGDAGLLVPTDYALTEADRYLILYGNVHNCLSLFKVSVLLRNARAVWGLLDVARVRFLRSDRCRRHRDAMLRHRTASLALTDAYCAFCVAVFVQWIVFAYLQVNVFPGDAAARDGGDVDDASLPPPPRTPNIINMPFPVNARAYNRYYAVFFAIEAVLAVYLVYCLLMVDLILFSFGWVIVAQHRVLARALRDVAAAAAKDEQQSADDDHMEELKSVLYDQQRLCSKLKSYCTIVTPIILMYVAVVSCLIIILTYALILIYMSPELFSILSVFKVGSTAFYLYLQLFIHCYLFDTLNLEMQSTEYGLYSCDWPKTDWKFKRALLLATRVSQAGRRALKVSPKKVINLQFFANVMMTCYNILSVMVKTTSRRNQTS